MSDSRLDKTGLISVWKKMKAYVNSFMSTVDAKISTLSVDYIVEQGNDGSWTYRKWNSGIAESWSTVSVPYANEYVCYKKFDLPNECVLTEIVCITATPNSDGGNSSQFLPTNAKAYARDMSTIGVAVHNSAGGWSSSFSIPISLHVIGKWK